MDTALIEGGEVRQVWKNQRAADLVVRHPELKDLVREFADAIPGQIVDGEVLVNPTPPTIDWAAVDQNALNNMLAAKGSVLRAVIILIFKEINKLRVKNGDPAYTLEQFKNALAAEQARD